MLSLCAVNEVMPGRRSHAFPATLTPVSLLIMMTIRILLLYRYALLCGRPPFETTTLKETYMRIVSNKFTIPPHVSLTARELIRCLLTLEPAARPTLDHIDAAEFFTDGHLPASLDPSTCHTPPKFPLPVFNPSRLLLLLLLSRTAEA